MSVAQDGITLSPKMLLSLLSVMGLIFAAGGSYYILKDAPKDISALALEHRGFEKEAHKVHHNLEVKDNQHDIILTEIRTNQTHMMKGIDRIGRLMPKHTGRLPAHLPLRDEDGG